MPTKKYSMPNPQLKTAYFDYVLKYEYRIFYSDEDKGYIATVAEIPGCSAFGETMEEAIKEAKIAAEAVLEYMQEERLQIPVPMCLKKYSGDFHVRMSPELHKKLVQESTIQNISLNSMVNNLISASLYKIS